VPTASSPSASFVLKTRAACDLEPGTELRPASKAMTWGNSPVALLPTARRRPLAPVDDSWPLWDLDTQRELAVYMFKPTRISLTRS